MIRSVSDSFMIPKNPRMGTNIRYRRSQTHSPATFKYSTLSQHSRRSLPPGEGSSSSQAIIVDEMSEEPLIRNRREFMILSGLAFLYMNANIGFSILAPFLPIEVNSLNLLSFCVYDRAYTCMKQN